MYKQAYGRKDFNRNNTQQDEINPKTLRLDKLVLLIDPQILAHYLEKVSAFLRSTKRDLWFPDVSPYLDAFLVRVIRDVQNFTSVYKCLDEKSRKAAEEIVATLIENEGVFRLDHKYDSMNLKPNVLVYKKVYEGMPEMDRLSHLAYARAALEEETNEEVDPPDLRQAIPTSFKVQWLKSIIKFIEDDNQQSVEYPEMSITEADFVYSLVRPDKLSALVGVGFKALYAPLAETLKALSFEIKASFLHVGSDRVRLSLEKAPRNDKTDEKPNDTITTPCNAKYVTKIEQSILKKQKLIDNLDITFMKTSLHMILDFITTESEASIVFKNANENQSMFIQSAGAMAKNKKFHSLFNEDLKVILRKMANVLVGNRDYELTVAVTKMEKDTKLRTVSLRKSPKWSPNNSLPESQNNSKQRSRSSLDSSLSHDTSINSDKKGPTNRPETNNPIVKEAIKPPTDKIPQTIDKSKPPLGIKIQTPKKDPIDNSKDKTLLNSKPTSGPKIQSPSEKDSTDNIKDKTLLKPNPLIEPNIQSTPKKDPINSIKEKALLNSKPPSRPEIQSPPEKDSIDNIKDKTLLKPNPSIVPNIQPPPSKESIVNTKDKALLKPDPPPSKKDPIDNTKNNTLPQSNPPKKDDSTDKILLNNNTADAVNRNITPQAVQTIDTRSLGPRKAKLIEAMSTPLESDIATRMMRQMGWEGGPLGIRGEGIVEPLIPALHLPAKAGFGHVKELPMPKENGKVSLRFRVHLFYQILHLLTENVQTREIEYSHALNKKETACAVNIVKAFNNRSNIQENDVIASNLIRDISKEMIKAPALTLLCYVLANNVLIITKIFNLQNTQIQPTPLPIANFKLTDILKKHINFTQNVTTELNLVIGKNIYSGVSRKKAAKTIGHKLLILYRLYTFLMTNEVQCEILFEYTLSKKHIGYVDSLILKFNARGKPSFSTPSENEIWTDITRIVADNNLILKYAYTIHKITFQKLKRQNQFMNSAKQKCDVVSNNIILTNKNKIIQPKTKDVKTPEVTKNDLSTQYDSDVEYVPVVNEVIVISDDESSEETDTGKKETLNDAVSDRTSAENDKKETPNDAVSDRTSAENDKKETPNDAKSDMISVENDKKETLNDEVSDRTSVSDFEKEIRDLEKAIFNTDITSKNNIDDSSHSSKRSRSDTSDLMLFNKKTKYQQHIRHLIISNEKKELKTETIQKFQNIISDKLDEVGQLPLLECHGVKDGGVAYSCHNDAGLLLINSVASEMNLKATDTTNNLKEKRRHKMKMKLNSFIGVNLKKLFSRIEFYNIGLTTDFWSVLDVHTYNDFIVIYLEIDDISFEYITEVNFSLFAGIDKVRFSTTWD